MSVFTTAELEFLENGPRLARIATVDEEGDPFNVPTGWIYNERLDCIDIGGVDLERTKKYRNARSTGKAAVVIDDVLPPWRPRALVVRGRAEVLRTPPLIRVHPVHVTSWGLESDVIGERHSRSVP